MSEIRSDKEMTRENMIDIISGAVQLWVESEFFDHKSKGCDAPTLIIHGVSIKIEIPETFNLGSKKLVLGRPEIEATYIGKAFL